MEDDDDLEDVHVEIIGDTLRVSIDGRYAVVPFAADSLLVSRGGRSAFQIALEMLDNGVFAQGKDGNITQITGSDES